MDNTLLNEIEKLNGTLDRFDKMNNGQQNQNNTTATTLQSNNNMPIEKPSSMLDGIVFDIILSIIIVIIRNILAIKFDEPIIRKIGYRLALVLPYFI